MKLRWRFWGWCRSTHVEIALAVLETVPVMAKDGPEFAALRLYEDIFVPANTTDPERARVIFRRQNRMALPM